MIFKDWSTSSEDSSDFMKSAESVESVRSVASVKSEKSVMEEAGSGFFDTKEISISSSDFTDVTSESVVDEFSDCYEPDFVDFEEESFVSERVLELSLFEALKMTPGQETECTAYKMSILDVINLAAPRAECYSLEFLLNDIMVYRIPIRKYKESQFVPVNVKQLVIRTPVGDAQLRVSFFAGSNYVASTIVNLCKNSKALEPGRHFFQLFQSPLQSCEVKKTTRFFTKVGEPSLEFQFSKYKAKDLSGFTENVILPKPILRMMCAFVSHLYTATDAHLFSKILENTAMYESVEKDFEARCKTVTEKQAFIDAVNAAF